MTAARRLGVHFTFIEVLIAALVLSISVAMVVAILGNARARILRAERRWGREHHLANLTEFHLLAGKEPDYPAGLLPQGFSGACDLVPAEDLPEHAAEALRGWDGWLLGVYRISVFDSYGRQLGMRTVEKLIKEDDLY